MLGNYLLTALRNLARNRLYAAITILGLAVAFTAAILIGQYVRGELTYDHWIPGYQRVYKIANTLVQPGQPPNTYDIGPSILASQIRAGFAGAEAIARIDEDFPPVKARPGDPAETERAFAWVDPDVFKVMPLPALAGDPATALQEPDTVVITRSMARKYFHRDLPIGDTLMVQTRTPSPPGYVAAGAGLQAQPPPTWRTMRVTAVLRDLPSNTNLVTEVFASGRSAYSDLAVRGAQPSDYSQRSVAWTFVRLKPGVRAADLDHALDIVTRPEQALAAAYSPGSKWLYRTVPLGEAHLTPVTQSAAISRTTGNRAIIYGIAGVGALIVLVAAINFVTLLTARAGRRALEVGVRKAVGASRADLMMQFTGEALIQVAISVVIALALAELLIGPFGAFTQRTLTVAGLHDPALLAAVLGVALVVGLVAAIYPALVLSSFRPAAVLKGGVVKAGGSALARQALVAVQFAILVFLIAATVTIYRQTQYALAQGLGGADNKLLVAVAALCDGPFDEEARKLPGVAGTACSSRNALNLPGGKSLVTVQVAGGRKSTFALAPVGFGFFELFGVKPLAGRTFQRDHGEDGVLADPDAAAMPTVIINQTAARALGFSDPNAAIGQLLSWAHGRRGDDPSKGPPPLAPSRIIGVVGDLPDSVRIAADPTFYVVHPPSLALVTVRMTGKDIPGTVKALAETWQRINAGRPYNSIWLSQFRLTQYLDLTIQSATAAIGAGLAVLIACLGLFALSAYTTEQRTKEIGVRKVMGADTMDVVLLLLWQFTIPVLVATAIAIPAGFAAMDWWLRGFVYHAPLSAWTFVLAAVAAVLIAWVTVLWQSFAVARAKPAGALRYE
jgi:putative ABC transport system permease protein